MRFSWDILQNMLENGHSNLQTNLWVHITSNIFKISNSKITGSHQPPWPPNFESLPYPGVGGRFGIYSLKWRERMNLKVSGAILPLGCAILSTRAKTVRGVGTTPLRRTRVKGPILSFQLFFSNFWRFYYHKKAHIFLITHENFYIKEVFRLEDINENVSGYGNHN